MKKHVLLGSFIFLVGVIIAGAAFASSGFNIMAISTRGAYEEKTLVVDNKNQDIKVTDSNVPVEIGKSNDGKIHLIYNEREKEYYDIENGSTLEIKKTYNYQWYDYIMVMDLYFAKVTILLPDNYTGNLDMATSNASISLDEISANQIKLATSNASIKLTDSKAESIISTTSNNRITAESLELQGELTLSSSNGSIQIAEVNSKSIDAKSSNSGINIKSSAAEKVKLHTSNGGITLLSLTGDDIDLYSSNNGISGSIVGSMDDFAIESRTSNGNNNLPSEKNGKDKSLKAITSNGGINVTFIN